MTNCNRCNQETRVFTMSWFNTEMICKQCDYKESQMKELKHAKEVELEECLKGNFNFKGIGFPKSNNN